MSKEDIVALTMQLQTQAALFSEKISVLTAARYGRKTEQFADPNQLSFFNEAEVCASEETKEPAIDRRSRHIRAARRRESARRIFPVFP